MSVYQSHLGLHCTKSIKVCFASQEPWHKCNGNTFCHDPREGCQRPNNLGKLVTTNTLDDAGNANESLKANETRVAARYIYQDDKSRKCQARLANTPFRLGYMLASRYIVFNNIRTGR